MKIAIVLALALVSAAAVPAIAQEIYDNGPTNGTTDGWTINFGFAVSDSFTLSSPVTVSGLNFAAWLTPGDVLQTAEVSITSSEFGGASYFDQTVTFTQSGCVTNQYGYNVCSESGIFTGPPSLNAGTYWLNLQNASVNTGDPIYWDENSGPSSASENSIGTIPSESFTLLGGCGVNGMYCTTTTSATPEPSSMVLFSSGSMVLFGLLGRLRRLF